MLSYRQAIIDDLAMWLGVEVMRSAIDAGFRHWKPWDKACRSYMVSIQEP